MADTITTELKSGYAILKVNRPQAMNALSAEVLEDLKEAINKVTTTPSLRVLIITGEGEKAFVAGADIKAMQKFSAREAEDFARAGHSTFNAIFRADIISIAAINGFALGGGLELALACDFRTAATTAKMGLPEVGLGIVPGFGGTQRLPRVIGKGPALEMILSGEMINAERAHALGLVNHLFEPADLINETIKIAEKLLEKGPAAQKMARWLVHSGMDLPLSAALEREVSSFSELFDSKEPEEGMSAFLDKRKANFSS